MSRVLYGEIYKLFKKHLTIKEKYRIIVLVH